MRASATTALSLYLLSIFSPTLCFLFFLINQIPLTKNDPTQQKMGQERQQQQSRYNSRNERDPIQSTSSSKSTISSLLSTFTPKTSANDKNKCYYTSSRFRGLGCTAPAQVSVPSMIRTSANWEEGKKLRKKKTKKNSNTNDGDGVSLVISTNTPPLDVWCGPGITDAASVDCLVSTTQKINKTTREVYFLIILY